MSARTDPDDWGDIPMPDDEIVFVNREMLPSRPPIAKGQWRLTLQLEVDGEDRGDPLVLRFADTYLSGAKSTTKDKKGSIGTPEDFGDIITHALYERALKLRKKPRAKK